MRLCSSTDEDVAWNRATYHAICTLSLLATLGSDTFGTQEIYYLFSVHIVFLLSPSKLQRVAKKAHLLSQLSISLFFYPLAPHCLIQADLPIRLQSPGQAGIRGAGGLGLSFTPAQALHTFAWKTQRGQMGLQRSRLAGRERDRQPPSGRPPPGAAGSRNSHYLDVFFEASPFRAGTISDAAGRRSRGRHVPRGFPSLKLARGGRV